MYRPDVCLSTGLNFPGDARREGHWRLRVEPEQHVKEDDARAIGQGAVREKRARGGRRQHSVSAAKFPSLLTSLRTTRESKSNRLPHVRTCDRDREVTFVRLYRI